MNAQTSSHVEAADTPHLSEIEKAKLLEIARETLTEYLTAGTTPEYTPEGPGLLQEAAAFVTLRRRNGELRGCIGRIEISQPLYRTVQESVISAATSCIHASSRGPSRTHTAAGLPAKRRDVNASIW